MVRSHVPLCRSVRGTKEGLAVLAIAAVKTSIPVIRRSNDIYEEPMLYAMSRAIHSFSSGAFV